MTGPKRRYGGSHSLERNGCMDTSSTAPLASGPEHEPWHGYFTGWISLWDYGLIAPLLNPGCLEGTRQWSIYCSHWEIISPTDSTVRVYPLPTISWPTPTVARMGRAPWVSPLAHSWLFIPHMWVSRCLTPPSTPCSCVVAKKHLSCTAGELWDISGKEHSSSLI